LIAPAKAIGKSEVTTERLFTVLMEKVDANVVRIERMESKGLEMAEPGVICWG